MLAVAASAPDVAASLNAQVGVQRRPSIRRGTARRVRPDDEDYADGAFDEAGVEAGYDSGARSFGFGIQVQGGGSANEYGPYGYPDRGYGVYAQWGHRNDRRSPLSVRPSSTGRRDGFEAGIDAARYGHSDPMRHRYYRSTRGWNGRYGARDAYDLNYRRGFPGPATKRGIARPIASRAATAAGNDANEAGE